MSDHHRQPPLTIRPVASQRLLVFVGLIHAAALAVLFPLPLPWWLTLGLAVLVVGDLAYVVWDRVLGHAPWSIVQATWNETGWTLITNNGRSQQLRLAASTYIGVDLVIVNLRAGLLRRRSLVLTPDNIDPDQLRRLRARLRLASS